MPVSLFSDEAKTKESQITHPRSLLLRLSTGSLGITQWELVRNAQSRTRLSPAPSALVHTSVLVLVLSPSLALNTIFPCLTLLDPLVFSKDLSADNCRGGREFVLVAKLVHP